MTSMNWLLKYVLTVYSHGVQKISAHLILADAAYIAKKELL